MGNGESKLSTLRELQKDTSWVDIKFAWTVFLDFLLLTWWMCVSPHVWPKFPVYYSLCNANYNHVIPWVFRDNTLSRFKTQSPHSQAMNIIKNLNPNLALSHTGINLWSQSQHWARSIFLSFALFTLSALSLFLIGSTYWGINTVIPTLQAQAAQWLRSKPYKWTYFILLNNLDRKQIYTPPVKAG